MRTKGRRLGASEWVTKRIGAATVEYRIHDGKLTLASIRVPQSKRQQGAGTTAMRALLSDADAAGLTVELVASPLDARTKTNRLVDFYSRFGFKTEERANPAGDHWMRRTPLGALPKAGIGSLSGVIEDLGLKLEEEISESDDMLDVRLYVVNAEGDEVGLVHAAHGGGRYAAIEDAKIDAAYQGKGLYPTMLMEMLNTLKGYGVKGIVSTPDARVGDDSRRSWEKFAKRSPRVRQVKDEEGSTFFLEGLGALPKSGRIPLGTAKRVMKRLPAKTRACGFSPAALREGMEIEREHRDVTGGAVLKTAKVAAAHLCERPDYYKRLKRYVER